MMTKMTDENCRFKYTESIAAVAEGTMTYAGCRTTAFRTKSTGGTTYETPHRCVPMSTNMPGMGPSHCTSRSFIQTPKQTSLRANLKNEKMQKGGEKQIIAFQ